MCIVAQSESGHGGRFDPCEAYIKLLSEKSRLEGRCAGLEEGNKINLERIKRQDAQLVGLLEENAALRQERDHLAGIVEKADALLNASYMPHLEPWALDRAQKSYQEARHG